MSIYGFNPATPTNPRFSAKPRFAGDDTDAEKPEIPDEAELQKLEPPIYRSRLRIEDLLIKKLDPRDDANAGKPGKLPEDLKALLRKNLLTENLSPIAPIVGPQDIQPELARVAKLLKEGAQSLHTTAKDTDGLGSPQYVFRKTGDNTYTLTVVSPSLKRTITEETVYTITGDGEITSSTSGTFLEPDPSSELEARLKTKYGISDRLGFSNTKNPITKSTHEKVQKALTAFTTED